MSPVKWKVSIAQWEPVIIAPAVDDVFDADQ
jgi:hypothetical protein